MIMMIIIKKVFDGLKWFNKLNCLLSLTPDRRVYIITCWLQSENTIRFPLYSL